MKRLLATYNRQSQLKKNVFSGTVFSVCNTVITLISYPVYLNYLGAESYGLWSIVAVVFSFSQFGQMGTDIAITKHVARECGKGSKDGITEYMSTAVCMLLVPSAFVILLLFYFRSQLADFLKLSDVFRQDGMKLMLYVGILSVFSFFVNLLKGLVAGIGRTDLTNYVFLSGKILQILVAVSLLIAGMGIWSLYYGFLVYFFVPFILWVLILKKKYEITIFSFRGVDKNKMNELLKYGGTLMAGMVAHMFVIPFNKLIIGRYVGLSEVAYYQIAVKVIMSLRDLFFKGIQSLLPEISENYGDGTGTFDSVMSIHRKGMKFIYYFALPLFALMFIFADIIMKLWLGIEFNSQITMVLQILLVGWLINALAVPDYFMFLGIGKVGYSVSATCIKSITNISLILLLILLHVSLTLKKIVVIDAISLSMAVMFLKYKYFEFKRGHNLAQN